MLADLISHLCEGKLYFSFVGFCWTQGHLLSLLFFFSFSFAVKLLQITNQEHVVNFITRAGSSGSSCTFKKCQAKESLESPLSVLKL